MAVVAVHRATTRPVIPRQVSTWVEAAVMVVSWSATTDWRSAGSTPATLDSCWSACSGVLTAP